MKSYTEVDHWHLIKQISVIQEETSCTLSAEQRCLGASVRDTKTSLLQQLCMRLTTPRQLLALLLGVRK
jgi:hypothetical protein